MVGKRVRVVAARGLFWAAGSALVLGNACGNPELRPGAGNRGGAALGGPCGSDRDCAEPLSCSSDGVCAAGCEADADSCGREVCLPSGRCSDGFGVTCLQDSDCSDGLLCSTFGRCSVACDGSVACPGGAACRSDGTCSMSGDVMLGVGGQTDEDFKGAGGNSGCIDVNVDFEPQVPTVLLLIDRSGSMNADNFGAAVTAAVNAGTYTLGDCPSNNDWRWNVVRDVLMNPTKGIVKPLEERVRFGLSLYSSKNGQIKPGKPIQIDPAKSCPVLIEVPIALDNHQAMLDSFKCSDIADDTPTGESLQAAAATLQAFTEPGPKVIVLATDGEPDTCECPDFGGDVPEKCKAPGFPQQVKEAVVETARQIHDGDITIHVINVSTPSNAALQQHLEDVADAGGGQVYPGFSPGALSEAFESIINGVRSCKIDLDGQIAAGKEDTGVVTLDGRTLQLGDADGWQVNTPSQIELLGSACEDIKSGGHDLKIRFPCDSFEPVVR